MSALLQFLVAGALVVAWTWILGRPLLSTLLRRSRRDSIGHFRYQQSVLGRSVGDQPQLGGWSLFGPLVEWWRQPVERRRLQMMMAFAFATFASALLAIALRGPFLRLFLMMSISFGAYLVMAASIGARELRAQAREQAEGSARHASAALARRQEAELERRDLLAGTGVAGALFDDGFFEPIPELDPRQGSGRRSERATQPATVGGPAGHGDDVDGGRPEVAAAGTGIFERSARPERAEHDVEVAPSATPGEEPTFTAPPVERSRPARRPKARPIYIEGDVEDESARAVND